MKKLMVMLSAAAMAFGLFAEPTYKTSFETGDDCVNDGVFTADDATWSGFTAPITLKKDDAKPACYGTGDLDRREEFNGLEDAHQYLPLETGKDTLNLAKGDVFLDQIVKFTGFEEEQTQFGDAKIAVWMSAIDDDETTEVNEADTNLYVAVGSQTGTQNVKLNYDVEPDTWYRLTIKKLENPILAADGNKLGGFIIYINGEQVGYDPTTILYSPDDLSSEAKSYAAAGQLLPAMAEDATFANTFASVGYNGIGAIDDIVVDEKGPKFTQFVEGTVGLIADATLVITNLAGGAAIEYDPVTGKFQAAPNSNLKLIYTAAEGKFLAPEGKQEVVYSEQITQNNKDFRDLVKDVEAKTAVATYVNDDSEYLLTDSLQDALDNDVGGEVALLINTVLADTLVVPDTFENGALDLGGNTITLAADKTVGIDVQADGVTISGGAIVSARAAYGVAYAILNSAVNATYEDLTIDAANYKFGLACDSAGDLADECQNPATVEVECNNVEITGNGGLFYAQHTILNLNDCTATGVGADGYAAAVYSALNAQVNIDGGEYDHEYALISGNLGGKITVTDGTFTGDIKSYMKVGAHSELEDYDGYKAVFTFNGGEYDGNIVFEDANARTLDSFTKAQDVVIEAPAGYQWANGTTLVPVDYVVKNADTGKEYATLAEAIDEAAADQTIQLLKDIEVADWVVVAKAVTIDFGTFKLTPATGFGRDALLCVNHGGDVTLNGTTGGIDSENVGLAIKMTANNDDKIAIAGASAANKAKLTVNGGVYVGTSWAISGNGNLFGADGKAIASNDSTTEAVYYRGNCELVVNGGTLTATAADGVAIYQPQDCVTTITDGTITGGAFGIYAKSGSVTVTGGDISSTAAAFVDPTVNNNGANGSGVAMVVESGSDQGRYANNMTFSVTGGEFTSVGPAVVNFVRTGAQPIAAGISGGLFQAKPADELLVASTTEGYKAAWVKDTVATDYWTPGEEAIKYTITFATDRGDKPADMTYKVTDTFPIALPTIELSGATFKGWTNETYTSAITELAKPATLGNIALVAEWEQLTGEPAKVITNDVEGDIPAGKEAEALANATALVNAKGDAAGVATWVATVYGKGGKIPAEKLANASAKNVALAVAFDVPVMVEPTISAPVVAEAAEGPAAFEFAIKDGSTEVEIKALTDKVKKIVKYAAALGGTNTFGPAKEDEVTIELDEGKIKAEFVAGPAAGFMKADFNAAE